LDKRRSYRQFCGLARALDRLGERWTLLIVRNLLLGPKRYSELLEGLPGITTNLLAKRLREMTALGLLEKQERDWYALSELGAALEPAIMELGRWGGRFLVAPEPGDRLDIAWALLSLKRRYRGGLELMAELRIDARTFELGFSPTYLSVKERRATLPKVTITGSADALRALLFLGVPYAELQARGALQIEGEIALFMGAFTAMPGPGAPAPTRSSAAAEPPPKARSRRASRRGA
jgi:DNA-binding HxlR family transcriptional regulator